MGSDFNHDGTLAMRRLHIDPEKIKLEQQERRTAARYVAGRAHDAADCADLLAALGLTAEEGKQSA
jgi:hypothetical protein